MPYDEKLAERIRARLKNHAGLAEKKMFGGVGFMINGNMACGVINEDLILRLSDDDFTSAMRKPDVRIFDVYGKAMQGWVLVAPGATRTATALNAWIAKGVKMATSLPAK